MSKEEFTKQVLDAEETMYRMAKTILGNDEDCADAMQSAILKAYEKLNTLRCAQYFKTWITRILINECYQLLRRNNKYVSVEDFADASPIKTKLVYEENCLGKSEVLQELMRLDEKFRVPLVLHEVEGYSLKEIAKILGLTETNVKTRIFRGKKMLRMRLEGDEEYVG